VGGIGASYFVTDTNAGGGEALRLGREALLFGFEAFQLRNNKDKLEDPPLG